MCRDISVIKVAFVLQHITFIIVHRMIIIVHDCARVDNNYSCKLWHNQYNVNLTKKTVKYTMTMDNL